MGVGGSGISNGVGGGGTRRSVGVCKLLLLAFLLTGVNGVSLAEQYVSNVHVDELGPVLSSEMNALLSAVRATRLATLIRPPPANCDGLSGYEVSDSNPRGRG